MNRMWTMLASCIVLAAAQLAQAAEVNVYSARKEALIQPLLDRFTAETGIEVNLVTGKAGQLHERLAAEGRNSPADVVPHRGRGQPAPRQGRRPVAAGAVAVARRGHSRTLARRRRRLVRLQPARPRDRLRERPRGAGRGGDLRGAGRPGVAGPRSRALVGQHLQPVADRIDDRGARHGGARRPGRAASSPTWRGRRRAAIRTRSEPSPPARATSPSSTPIISAASPRRTTRTTAPSSRRPASSSPTRGDAGRTSNVSGGGLCAHAPNAAEGTRLLEYLASAPAQALFAELNHEIPVRADVALSPNRRRMGRVSRWTTCRWPCSESATGRRSNSPTVPAGADTASRRPPHGRGGRRAGRSAPRRWRRPPWYPSRFSSSPRTYFCRRAGCGRTSSTRCSPATSSTRCGSCSASASARWSSAQARRGCAASAAFPAAASWSGALLLPMALPTYAIALRLRRSVRIRGPGAVGPARLVRLDRARLLVTRTSALSAAPSRSCRWCSIRTSTCSRAPPSSASRSACSKSAARSAAARGGASPKSPCRSPGRRSAGGVALALMEALSDFGTVDYYGVDTFTTGIYRTWFALGDAAAAAQLSAVLLAFVLVLLVGEQQSRRGARYHHTTGRQGALPSYRLHGVRAGLAAAACALPLALGFLVPSRPAGRLDGRRRTGPARRRLRRARRQQLHAGGADRGAGDRRRRAGRLCGAARRRTPGAGGEAYRRSRLRDSGVGGRGRRAAARGVARQQHRRARPRRVRGLDGPDSDRRHRGARLRLSRPLPAPVDERRRFRARPRHDDDRRRGAHARRETRRRAAADSPADAARRPADRRPARPSSIR